MYYSFGGTGRGLLLRELRWENRQPADSREPRAPSCRVLGFGLLSATSKTSPSMHVNPNHVNKGGHNKNFLKKKKNGTVIFGHMLGKSAS